KVSRPASIEAGLDPTAPARIDALLEARADHAATLVEHAATWAAADPVATRTEPNTQETPELAPETTFVRGAPDSMEVGLDPAAEADLVTPASMAQQTSDP